MRKNPFNIRIIIVLRIALGCVFVFAAIGKIADPEKFSKEIDNYQLLPYALVTLAAAILPWLEALCGTLLIFGRWLKGSSFIIILLNFVFIGAISSAMARGLDIDCGCFSSDSKVGILRLIEDFLFLTTAFAIFLSEYKKELARE